MIAFHPAIRAAAAGNALDPPLLWTIAYLETRFRPQLVWHNGARGLMQFILSTGRGFGLLTHSDSYDPLLRVLFFEPVGTLSTGGVVLHPL